ncbi:MAG: protein kinase [Myxococcota bacterium]|nr:protein kinase [Myxococcota bacterium]
MEEGLDPKLFWILYEQEEGLEIFEEIGAGSFGRVYRGRHLRLDVPVAIKVLHPQHAQGETLQMFVREATLMARLDHPNLLRVFDLSTGPEGPYLVTEWMAGGAVKGPIAQEDELRAIGVAMASGLEALHLAGIVHRDIKPENVMRTGDGRVKLGDLGIAGAIDPTILEERLMGSPRYMAPELFKSPPSYGSKSDLWALGASLFELWAGEPAFDGDSLSGLVRAICHEPPRDIEAVRSGLSASTLGVIGGLMHHDPSVRPTSAEVVAALAETLDRTIVDHPTLIPDRERHAVGEVGAWVLTEEIYRSSNWLGHAAHHQKTGRAARLSQLRPTSPLPGDLVVESAARAADWEHDGLTEVLDWGQDEDGSAFVVFDSLGQTLDQQVLAQGPLDEPAALLLVVQIASAVAYLHDQGFVYQMVEPGSVYTTSAGVGFALGWPCFSCPLGERADRRRVFVPKFADPSVWLTETFSAQTDIFGLGALLWFSLTGRGVCEGDGTALPLSDPAFVRQALPEVTARTQRLLGRLAHPEGDQRPTSAAEVEATAQKIRKVLGA